MEATVSYLLMLQKIHQFKAKESEIKDNISKYFTINDMKKNKIKRNCKTFFLLILILLVLMIF